MNQHQPESAVERQVLDNHTKQTGPNASSPSADAKFKFSPDAIDKYRLSTPEILRDLALLSDEERGKSDGLVRLNKNTIDNVTTPSRPGVSWPTFLDRLMAIQMIRPELVGIHFNELVFSSSPVPDGLVGMTPASPQPLDLTDPAYNASETDEEGESDLALRSGEAPNDSRMLPGSESVELSTQQTSTVKLERTVKQINVVSSVSDSRVDAVGHDPVSNSFTPIAGKSATVHRRGFAAGWVSRFSGWRIRIASVLVGLLAVTTTMIIVRCNDTTFSSAKQETIPHRAEILFQARGVDSEVKTLAVVELYTNASPQQISKEGNLDVGLREQGGAWSVFSQQKAFLNDNGVFSRSMKLSEGQSLNESIWVFLPSDQPVRQIIELLKGRPVNQDSLGAKFVMPSDWLQNHRHALNFLKKAGLNAPSKLTTLIQSELELVAADNGLLYDQEVDYRHAAAANLAEWYLHPEPVLTAAEYHSIAVALRLFKDERATEFFLYELNSGLGKPDSQFLELELMQTLPNEGRWSTLKTSLANQVLSKTLTDLSSVDDSLLQIKLLDTSIRFLLTGWRGETSPNLDTSIEAKSLELLNSGLDIIDGRKVTGEQNDDASLKFIINTANAISLTLENGTFGLAADASTLLKKAKEFVELPAASEELRSEAFFAVAQLSDALRDQESDEYFNRAIEVAKSLPNKKRYFIQGLEQLMRKAGVAYNSSFESNTDQRLQLSNTFKKLWLEYCETYDEFVKYPCPPSDRFTSLSNMGVLSYQGVHLGVVEVDDAWQLSRSISKAMKAADRFVENATSVAISQHLAVDKLSNNSLSDDDLISLLVDATEVINLAIADGRPKSLNELYGASRSVVLALDRNERLLQLPLRSVLVEYLASVGNLGTQKLWKVDPKIPDLLADMRERLHVSSDSPTSR